MWKAIVSNRKLPSLAEEGSSLAKAPLLLWCVFVGGDFEQESHTLGGVCQRSDRCGEGGQIISTAFSSASETVQRDRTLERR